MCPSILYYLKEIELLKSKEGRLPLGAAPSSPKNLLLDFTSPLIDMVRLTAKQHVLDLD